MALADTIEHAGIVPVKRTWYRTTLFNACVIGFVGFLAPGLWNAMNSLGAGGEEKPFLVNAANALVFGLMGIFCLFGAPIANRIGLKWALVLGATGYPLYSAGLYTNDRFGNVWFVLVGSAACGISAGLYWATEGAIAIGYPEPAKRARYINLWVVWSMMGPIVGNAIVLGLNINTDGEGSVGYTTYIVFIALQCLAVPVALLLSPPEKVQRDDGTAIVVRPEASWKEEFQALWRTCKLRSVILLLPIFWAIYFNEYSSNYKTYYFSVRARALIAFLTDWVAIIASQSLALWLDWKKFDRKTRITYSWYWVILVHVVTWIYAWVVQSEYTANPPFFDIYTPGFVKGAFTLFLWQFAQQTGENWLYYLVGEMTDNIAELTRLTGILRGQMSFGEAVSYGLNTHEWYGGRAPMAVNTILLGLCVVPTWIVVRKFVPDEEPMTLSTESDQQIETEVIVLEKEKISRDVGQASSSDDQGPL